MAATLTVEELPYAYGYEPPGKVGTQIGGGMPSGQVWDAFTRTNGNFKSDVCVDG